MIRKRLLGMAYPAAVLMLGASAIGCSETEDITVLEAQLELLPATLDFGPVQIGTELTKTVTVRNPGNAVLNLKGAREGDPFDSAFTFSLDQTAIPAGTTAQLSVTFAPEADGLVTATIVVESDDANVPDKEVVITGSGVTPTLRVDPQSVDFGNVVINSTKRVSIEIENESDLDASISLLAGNNVRTCAEVSDPSVFCVKMRGVANADGTIDLAARARITLDLEFTPVISETRERGDFKLVSCDSPECETEIRLEGTGVEQGFSCDPTALDFMQVNPGSTLSRTVTCQNVANERITIVGWGPSTTPATSPDFTIEPSQVVVLEEGDSFDVEVSYTPDDIGDDDGNLQIETDQPVPNRFVLISLEGQGGGPDIEVFPSPDTGLNFGLVSLNAPARRSILVTNVGADPLEVTEIIADTAGTGAFSAPNAMPVTIAPGASETIVVEFQPVAVGPVNSTLLITSNDQDEAEVSIPLRGEGIDLPPCQFELAPANLAFGVVQVQRFQGRAFEIRNVGADDCLVTSANMEAGSDPQFSMPDGDVRSQIIGPGSAYTIRVDYSPDVVGTHSGAVEFSISSDTNPFNRVPLTGTGADATLLIVPNELDFGTIGVGCSSRARIVQIYNTGATAAVIDNIQLAAPGNPAFTLSQLPGGLGNTPPTSATIQPGQSVEFAVTFRADAISRYAAAIEIIGTFEGNQVTYLVSVQGEGSLDATQEDRFEQLGTPKVDILFVIDFSGSMSQEQTAMAANFSAFIQFAEAQALDYQIGVTSTGTAQEGGRLFHTAGVRAGDGYGGPFANRIVTPSTQPDPETVFSQNVQAINLYGGSAADEAGFFAAYQALTPPVLTGHNAGFLRPDAVLSIIFVSDEQEQTSTSFAPADDIDFYVNFFLSIKGFRNTNLFTASAIVGDDPGGCNGSGGNADAAPRYIAAANRTGGVFQSICTPDWSRSLEDLSTTAFGFKSRFFLTNQPVIGSIEVEIDGVDVPATGTSVNWTYDFATNSVNFSPFSTPEPGAQIVIRYTAECL